MGLLKDPKSKPPCCLLAVAGCHSKVRVASGVINFHLALRTGRTVLGVSRLGLFARLPGDALDYGFVGTEKLPYWRIEFLASVFCNGFTRLG